MEKFMYLSIGTGIIVIIYALLLFSKVKKINIENQRVQELQEHIHNGAITFLLREYKIISIFSVFIFLILASLVNISTAICFVVGVIIASIISFIGLHTATIANAKTTQIAQENDLAKALETSYNGGSSMGMGAIGISFIAIAITYLIYRDVSMLSGFALGFSSVALFIRISGGIFTKAADISAGLIAKMGVGLEEEDPRNPTAIADNVGDNIGNIVAANLDLIDSFIISLIATFILGSNLKEPVNSALELEGYSGVLFPIFICGIGIFASIIGSIFVKWKKATNLQKTLQTGVYISAFIMLIASFVLSKLVFNSYNAFFALSSGLVAAIIIRLSTEWFTSYKFKNVKNIVVQSETGSAFTLFSGLSIGLRSTIIPSLAIVASILISYKFMSFYGVGLSAIGLISIVAITIAVDTYGAIADNACGIAKMVKLDECCKDVTSKLDSVGNASKAIGKGYSIACAMLSSIALFAAYINVSNIEAKDLSLFNPSIIIGLIIGGMIPFAFTSLTIDSVRKMTFKMIAEVLKIFKEDPEIISGKSTPNYKQTIDNGTSHALKEMIIPAAIAILAPVLCGLLFGKNGLAGLLIASIITGTLMAIFMTNAGTAWNNAKNYLEIDQSQIHSAEHYKSINVGDTVGDAFKDTAGPSLNILIKIMTIIALVLASVEIFGIGLFN